VSGFHRAPRHRRGRSFHVGGSCRYAGRAAGPGPTFWSSGAFGSGSVAHEISLARDRGSLGAFVHTARVAAGLDSSDLSDLGHVEGDDRFPDVHQYSFAAVQRADGPTKRAGQRDNGLRRLHIGNVLVKGDSIARSHVPRDDLRFGEALTEVRQGEDPDHERLPSTRSTPSSMRSRSGRWCRSSLAAG